MVETVAVSRGGGDGLRALFERGLPQAPGARMPEGADVHDQTRRLLDATVSMPTRTARIDDALDRWLLHPVAGLAALALLMFLVFQAVYAWATPLMDGIESATGWVGGQVVAAMPEGPLRSLLVDGVIAGLGGVIVFLPQILVLFFFILLLEESGYLPRAAFLLDRTMAAAGLSGRSFIPLLSSFACAVPGIMSTRSIQDPRDRLATILVAPLMTCSARLPVYALLIGAFIPARKVGPLNLQGLVLFVLYAAGIASALLVSWIMKKWRRDDGEHPLLLELPSYRLPSLRDVAIGLWERAMIFLRRVGGIILALTVLLWFLLNVPAGAGIEDTLGGRIGRALALVFAPLGFDWHISIALIPTMAAREVMVSSLATVYSLAAASDEAAAQALSPVIAAQWSAATGIALLVWFIYAPHCISTLATIRRETHSWKQTGWATLYLFGLAYAAAFIAYRAALALGWG